MVTPLTVTEPVTEPVPEFPSRPGPMPRLRGQLTLVRPRLSAMAAADARPSIGGGR